MIKFSAGGFRDFTRIAASDPVMWRDIFLNNREAVLEMLGRFSEDLAALQRAIRCGEGDTLEELFTRTRADPPLDHRSQAGVALGKRKHCETMAEVRAEIDALDRGIVALLADRLHYIEEAARIKRSRDQVRDEARIADVLKKVEAEAPRIGANASVLVETYRTLIEASIA